MKIPTRYSLTILSASVISGALFLARPVLADYTVETVSNGGTIEGVVKLSGAAQIAPITVTKNQDYCGQSIPSPVYSIGKDGGLQNVEVYLKGITRGKALLTDTISLVNEQYTSAKRLNQCHYLQYCPAL
jgi:hypothetical protein